MTDATARAVPTRSVARAATGMGAATALSRAFGFVRVLTVAAILGTTYLGNAFQSANLVSNVLFELIAAGALSAALVPTFVRSLERHDDREVERLAGGLLGIATVVLGVVSVVGVVAAPWIADLLTAGVRNPSIRAQQAELTTFLLRFFVPQVVFYAWGTIAIAVLNAKRRFALPAAAPIANTVVMVVLLVMFRVVAGPNPSLELSTASKLTLAAAGTLGVVAYVAVPTVALFASGFRPRIRVAFNDRAVRSLLGLSGWATLLHIGTGLLLGAAIVVGNGVAGGSVAYNVAFVFFLAPYAILAQPVLTAILPELANERRELRTFAGSTRWSLDTMALLVVPVSVAMVALALPFARAISFGSAASAGPELIAAGIASLGVGLYGYSAFLMLARASYALDDSRTPAIVGVLCAALSVLAMVVGAPMTTGAARVALIGGAHSGAMILAAAMLGAWNAHRLGHSLVPTALIRSLLVALPLGLAAWWCATALDPQSRLACAALVAVVGAVGGAVYLLVIRVTGGFPSRVATSC
ncbi:MAG: murein biosynthesis integral membrane protein MurJ [Acidimicrobiia bacterium]